MAFESIGARRVPVPEDINGAERAMEELNKRYPVERIFRRTNNKTHMRQAFSVDDLLARQKALIKPDEIAVLKGVIPELGDPSYGKWRFRVMQRIPDHSQTNFPLLSEEVEASLRRRGLIQVFLQTDTIKQVYPTEKLARWLKALVTGL